jgi:hypothetical protein
MAPVNHGMPVRLPMTKEHKTVELKTKEHKTVELKTVELRVRE